MLLDNMRKDSKKTCNHSWIAITHKGKNIGRTIPVEHLVHDDSTFSLCRLCQSVTYKPLNIIKIIKYEIFKR